MIPCGHAPRFAPIHDTTTAPHRRRAESDPGRGLCSVWRDRGATSPAPPAPTVAATLREPTGRGVVARMDSPALTYDTGWTVGPDGADPSEPADPWSEPAGVVTFTYTGRDLALDLATGDYWGYLYVTVDGAPANRLADIPGNVNQLGEQAGYRTFYAPERARPRRPGSSSTPPPMPHGNTPCASKSGAVGGKRLCAASPWMRCPRRPSPLWPGVLAVVVGLALLAWSWPVAATRRRVQGLSRPATWLTLPVAGRRGAWVAALGATMVAVAMLTRIWWLSPPGLALLAYASLVTPSYWAMAWLFALPFYFSQTVPILPGRATNLVDLGAWGGLAVSLGHWLIAPPRPSPPGTSCGSPFDAALAGDAGRLGAGQRVRRGPCRRGPARMAHGLSRRRAGWASCSPPAGTTRTSTGGSSAHGWRARWSWRSIGLVQFVGDVRLIEAEGVRRVRALYGSPNNLALYLERGLMVTLAFTFFVRDVRVRMVAGLASALQGAALLLTFSKGALVLGLPAGLATLWLGGLALARRRGASTRPLLGHRRGGGRRPDRADALPRHRTIPQPAGLQPGDRPTPPLSLAQQPANGAGPSLAGRRAGQLPLHLPQHLSAARGLAGAKPQPPARLAAGRLDYVWGCRGWRCSSPGLSWGCAASGGASGPRSASTTPARWLALLAATAAALAHGSIDLSYAVPDLMLVWVLILALPELAPNQNGPTSS